MLLSLISLLVIIGLAYFWSPMAQATGLPHPQFPGMYISTANIDQAVHTRWLGYLFGLAIIVLFGSFLFLGNRKKGKSTPMKKWLWIGLGAYVFVFSGMVFSHWQYVMDGGGEFLGFLPLPTAWMIVGVWLTPIIITAAYSIKFDDWIISEAEIAAFHEEVSIEEDSVE